MSPAPGMSPSSAAVRINDGRYCTGFFTDEAKQLADIIAETLDEEPPAPPMRRIFVYLAKELRDRARELEEMKAKELN